MKPSRPTLLVWTTACVVTALFGSSVSACDAAELAFHNGDHVAIVGNTFADQMRKYGYFETLLQYRHVGFQLSVRNFGKAGDTVTDRARPENFSAEDETLTEFETDVIIAYFGMGEHFLAPGACQPFETA